MFLRNAPGAIVHTGGKVPLARSAVTPPIPRSIECGWEIGVVPNVPVQAPIGIVAKGDGIVGGSSCMMSGKRVINVLNDSPVTVSRREYGLSPRPANEGGGYPAHEYSFRAG